MKNFTREPVMEILTLAMMMAASIYLHGSVSSPNVASAEEPQIQNQTDDVTQHEPVVEPVPQQESQGSVSEPFRPVDPQGEVEQSGGITERGFEGQLFVPLYAVNIKTINHSYFQVLNDFSVLANGQVPGPPIVLIDLNGGLLQSGDKVQLKVVRQEATTYFVAEGGGGREVKADRRVADLWETFTVKKVGGPDTIIRLHDTVTLQAYNGMYVTAEKGGGGAVNANRTVANRWEWFQFVRSNDPAGNQTLSGGDEGKGPYYRVPSWGHKLPATTRFFILNDWGSQAVLDKETGLVWERKPISWNAFGTVGTENYMDWGTARITCLRKTIGGRKGWRLPSITELMSVVESLIAPPAPPTLPYGHPFLLPSPEASTKYWSATTNIENTFRAWAVDLSNASQSPNWDKSASKNFTWCVRGPMKASKY